MLDRLHTPECIIRRNVNLTDNICQFDRTDHDGIFVTRRIVRLRLGIIVDGGSFLSLDETYFERVQTDVFDASTRLADKDKSVTFQHLERCMPKIRILRCSTMCSLIHSELIPRNTNEELKSCYWTRLGAFMLGCDVISWLGPDYTGAYVSKLRPRSTDFGPLDNISG